MGSEMCIRDRERIRVFIQVGSVNQLDQTEAQNGKSNNNANQHFILFHHVPLKNASNPWDDVFAPSPSSAVSQRVCVDLCARQVRMT